MPMQFAQTRMGDSIATAKQVTLVMEHRALQTSALSVTQTIRKLAQTVLYTASTEQLLATLEPAPATALTDLVATTVTNALLEKVSMVKTNVSLAQTSRQTTKSLTVHHVLTKCVKLVPGVVTDAQFNAALNPTSTSTANCEACTGNTASPAGSGVCTYKSVMQVTE